MVTEYLSTCIGEDACFHSFMLGFVLLDHIIDLIAEGCFFLKERWNSESNPYHEYKEVEENQSVETMTQVTSNTSRQEIEVIHFFLILSSLKLL
jgi:hypothetical protein